MKYHKLCTNVLFWLTFFAMRLDILKNIWSKVPFTWEMRGQRTKAMNIWYNSNVQVHKWYILNFSAISADTACANITKCQVKFSIFLRFLSFLWREYIPRPCICFKFLLECKFRIYFKCSVVVVEFFFDTEWKFELYQIFMAFASNDLVLLPWSELK